MVFFWIWKIVVEVKIVEYDLVQPYFVWRVETEVWKDEFTHPYDNDKTIIWVGENYPLIAPSEMAFSLRWNELDKSNETKFAIIRNSVYNTLCGNKDDTVLELSDETDANNR